MRSGVLVSVHAFASDPSRGLFILVLLIVAIGGSLLLYALKGGRVRARVEHTLWSRETFLLGNNILLMAAMLVVLLGTLLPLVHKELGLGSISIGEPFFNTMFTALMAPFALLLGLGPLIRWRRDDVARQIKRLIIALLVTLSLSLALPWLLQDRITAMAVIGLMMALWVLIFALMEVHERATHRHGFWRGLRTLTRSQWGMVLGHVGVAVTVIGITFSQKMKNMVGDLNICSKKGLSERFDSTIGAATVLMPFGGAYQLTPQNAMVAKLPVDGETNTCSGMAWGYNPYLMSANQYIGARMAVVDSVTKLVASGFRYEDAYLTFQEYFERLGTKPERWGKPLAALLGALDAQMGLGIASIGGKDSMSGSFEQLDVPPTLVSFATAIGKASKVVSTEFKKPESTVVLIRPILDPETGCPNFFSLKANYKIVEQMIEEGMVASACAVGYGGIAEALFKMGLGNRIGFKMRADMPTHRMFEPMYGSIVLEMVSDSPAGELLGETTREYTFESCGETLDMAELQEIWESKLEPVYPYRKAGPTVEKINGKLNAPAAPKIGVAKPKVIIPVFPGTNCEYDTAKAFARAGADPEILVIRNLTPADVTASCEALVKAIGESQIVMLPGGFSGGDEPDGSAKFIASFFRSPAVTEAVRDLLQHRDGLMLGICNGFQALIKLGLVPYGDIRPITAYDPTLTFNTIGRHQSMLVRTRVASTGSPWLSHCDAGSEYEIAISHGEGRFVAPQNVLDQLVANGQVATQYVDLEGEPTMDQRYNPNGSLLAIEGITSPDGRVFGKMGHSERSGEYLYKNVTGDKYQPIFEGGVDYFKV